MSPLLGLGLPLLAQDFTDAQVETCVLHFAGYRLAALRRQREAHSEALVAAQRLGQPELVLSEQIRLDIVTDAICRQTFGYPQDGVHTIREFRSDLKAA